jgi:hypothetical protein
LRDIWNEYTIYTLIYIKLGYHIIFFVCVEELNDRRIQNNKWECRLEFEIFITKANSKWLNRTIIWRRYQELRTLLYICKYLLEQRRHLFLVNTRGMCKTEQNKNKHAESKLCPVFFLSVRAVKVYLFNTNYISEGFSYIEL